MKVLGVLGSPRRKGNTDLLLDAALEGAREAGAEVEKLVLEEMDLRGCRECDSCLATGKCVVEDDMQRIYRKIDELDVIIVASPVFFSGLTAQTKMMIDRCQCLWAGKYMLGRPAGQGRRRIGAFLSVGGRSRSNFKNAISEVKAFFLSINVEYAGEVTVPGIEGKGAIRDHPASLDEARELGRKIVRSLS